MEKEKGKTCKGKHVGSWVGVSGKWAQVPTEAVTCMQALMGFVVSVRVVFGVVVNPVLGACIPVITKLILG